MSAPILSAYDWQVQNTGVRHLRAGFLTSSDGKMQVRYKSPTGVVTWVDLILNLGSTNFNFSSFYDNTNKQDLLLMVNGQPGIYEWSGGLATLAASSNSNTIIGTIATIPSFGGGGYAVGDKLTISGGTGGSIIVQAITNNAILTVNPTPITGGQGYSPGDVLSIINASATNLASIRVLTTGSGNSIATFELISQGGGYNVDNYNVQASSGFPFDPAEIQVTAIANGAVSLYALNSAGSGYSTGVQNTTGGSGTNATVDILTLLQGSITIAGSNTIAQEGFYLANSQLIINDNLYSYTSQSGNDFIGVSPDPTGEPVDSVVLQAVKFTLNLNMLGIPGTFSNQLIATLNNQIYVGSLQSNQIYVSRNTNYKDFTSDSPRLPGQGALLTLDSPAVALIPQENDMYMSAGLDEWYLTVFTLSADLTAESLQINRLKTTTGQGTQSQALTTKVKDNVVFISNEPIVNTLGRVSNVVLTPQLTDISYSIVNDINGYDFTDGCAFYFQKFLYVAIPKESIVRIYNMTNEDKKGAFYWEAPQILPISRFSIIDGELYGHSYQVSETYKLFTGYNDNGHAYQAIALFSYQQDGTRSASKSFNEFYSEGYIAANTILTNGFNFDTDGNQTTTTFPINGSDTQIVGIKSSPASLGKAPLGKNSIGGDLNVNNNPLPPKFRVIKTFPRIPYYEYQPFYSSTGLDQQWELIAFGAATSPTTEDNQAITE